MEVIVVVVVCVPTTSFTFDTDDAGRRLRDVSFLLRHLLSGMISYRGIFHSALLPVISQPS